MRNTHEEAVKLKVVRKLRYGKYLVTLPTWIFPRFRDDPVPGSICESRELLFDDSKKDCKFISGQQLFGVMIPRHEEQNEKNSKDSKSKQKKLLGLLKKNKKLYSKKKDYGSV